VQQEIYFEQTYQRWDVYRGYVILEINDNMVVLCLIEDIIIFKDQRKTLHIIDNIFYFASYEKYRQQCIMLYIITALLGDFWPDCT